MYKALLFKEWLKTKRVFFISLFLAIIVAIYAIMQMKSLIETKGMESLWLTMILKDATFVDILTYIPLLIGIATGFAQMSPEMSHKRLKLTLHLPYPTMKLTGIMLGVGLLQLTIIFILQAAIVAIYDTTILPSELTGRVLLTIIPWYIGGYISYLFVSAICLEGKWLIRLLLGVLGVGVLLPIYIFGDAIKIYTILLPVIIIFTIVLTILSFGSVARFKEGLQD